MSFRLSLLAGVFAFTQLPSVFAAEPPEIHYAPVENLERVDVGLLRAARAKIDLAAYVLTDWPIIGALIDAHRRGVAVRIVLDPSERSDLDRLREIAADVRISPPGPFMHLKSYTVDSALLRSGSANLTASGLKQQDNDLLVLRDPAAVQAFEARFAQIWSAAKPIGAPGPSFASRLVAPASANSAAPTTSCAIKGNISRRGERIFHKPGEPFYDRVKIDQSAGERWFCSEQEAVAAGWRHGRVD
ncbi:phospholipase D-like domain-containing protein [Methylosinus sp. LW3]|uniref:phospholipase D-like domain-containing protein n=1 Tax=Methylosinus sp. LW3 TaxID=107635 RepID=UPI000465DA0F|nr:phospholipase D-like domain-containing protein [Methylosinus sp. LW3]